MRWSNDHACSAMFYPLAHVLTFLTCSFLRVSKQRPVSPYSPTLRNMRGHLTIAQILTILVSLTKAVFELEKHWRLGTPLLPSMLIINKFKADSYTSRAFFLNNSYLIYTSILCFCISFYNFFLLFSFRLFCIYFVIPRFIFIRRRLQTDSRKLILVFNKFFSQRICNSITSLG